MPAGWAWCRFGNFIDVRDGTHYSPKYVEKGYPFVTSKNLVNGKIDFTDVKYISEKDHNDYIQRSYVEDGDILFAMIGSIGNPVLVKKDREFSIKNVALFKPYSKQLTNMNYLFYFLLWIQENLRSKAKGGMQPFIPLSFFRTEVLIPIPPAEEQFRIVSNIEENLSKIDFIEENKRDLENIIKQAKSKILDLAIHGKLVPQDPNDEPAEELLKRIATSDNRPYEKMDESEKLFEAPTSWCWSKLKNICSDFIVPQRDKPKVFDGNIPWCRIEDIEGKYLKRSLSNQLVSKETIKQMNMHICPVGSVICSCSASLGIQAITTVECCTNQTFIGIAPVNSVLYNEYLFYYLKAHTKYFHEIATGTTIKYISRDKFEELPFALPPFEEQKRIVSKIEELYSKLDEIVLNLV